MPVISVKNVCKDYTVYQNRSGFAGALVSLFKPLSKSVNAVKSLSFDIAEGEFVGFIGENGAGKSTTIKMMSGILFPTSGTVHTMGLEPYKKRRENAANIGVVFGQRTRLIWALPMLDSFALYKELYKIPTDRYERNVKMFIDMLDMGAYANTPVRQLSLGQRMRVEIALSMLHDPPILFLDEPTIGLDVVAKKYIRDFFKERNERDGTTLLLTSHDMKDLDTLAHRVVMITKGELLFDGTISEMKARYGSESLAEFTFSGQHEKVTIAFDPAKQKLQDIIAEVSAQGEIANVEVKSADIEDIVRKIYN